MTNTTYNSFKEIMAELIDLKGELNQEIRAMLVGLKTMSDSQTQAEALLEELEELAANLNIITVGKIIVNLREPNAHFLIGKGKFEEILSTAKELGANCIILDDELSPAQQRNWEEESQMSVVNRQEIILDIFAERAQTKEATLQVELAKLEYSLPRLRKAWSHLDRQRGGGVTQRGGGESQLELDRRLIKIQIAKLQEELAQVRTMRSVQRKRRNRVPVPSAAVVGYTNAGKSSLINAIAGADLLAEDKLFATLDPTTRRLELPNGMQLLLTDTVGFVRKLPHKFIEAFKSTLEEATLSDFLIHVVDSNDADALDRVKTTLSVLQELGADMKKIVTVVNKIDLGGNEHTLHELSIEYPNAVWVSVKDKQGFDELLKKLEDMISHTARLMNLFIPHSDYKAVADLHKIGAIISSKNLDEGVELKANVPLRLTSTYEIFL